MCRISCSIFQVKLQVKLNYEQFYRLGLVGKRCVRPFYTPPPPYKQSVQVIVQREWIYIVTITPSHIFPVKMVQMLLARDVSMLPT